MPANPFENFVDSPGSAAADAFAIVPHATDTLPVITKALYVGGAGDIVLRLASASSDTLFKNVAAGTILDLRVLAVRAAGTSATFIVGLA